MAAVVISGPPRRSREFISLREATESGLPYSTLRGYIAEGRLAAFKTPNRKVWVRAADVAALFQPVKPHEED